MEFEWDDDKFATNLAKHKVSFEKALLIFDGPIMFHRDERQDYGEARYVFTGESRGQFYVVIYTMRGSIVRIISARFGGRRDRKDYHSYFAS